MERSRRLVVCVAVGLTGLMAGCEALSPWLGVFGQSSTSRRLKRVDDDSPTAAAGPLLIPGTSVDDSLWTTYWPEPWTGQQWRGTVQDVHGETTRFAATCAGVRQGKAVVFIDTDHPSLAFRSLTFDAATRSLRSFRGGGGSGILDGLTATAEAGELQVNAALREAVNPITYLQGIAEMASLRVAGQEDVTVRAGTYSAIRVEAANPERPREVIGSLWLVRGMGPVKLHVTIAGKTASAELDHFTTVGKLTLSNIELFPGNRSPAASPGLPSLPPARPSGLVPTASPPSSSLAEAALLGTWGGTLAGGQYVELTFLSGERLLLRAGGNTLTGSYRTDGSTVTLQFPGEQPVTHTATFRDGGTELLLGTQRYRRVR